MSEGSATYFDTFPAWLRTLGADAEQLASILEDESLPEPVAAPLAGGLNYLFKSLDLVPDGIDDIGYLDDAFVLRVAADLAANEEAADGDQFAPLRELAAECELVREFLGSNYTRLENYVKGLGRLPVRGRAVGDILSDSNVRAEFLADVRGFAKSYQIPSFSREEKNLIKLRHFLDAKLPK